MKIKFFDDIERLRGFACILVLIQHIAWACPLRFVYNIVPQCLLVGSGGVHLFFAISGFVVTLSLRDQLNSLANNVFLDRLLSAKELLLSFYKRRFFRIYPVVFFVMTLMCVFLNFAEDDLSWMSSFLRTPAEIFFGVYNNSAELFSGKERIHFGGLGPFWTLAVETQFYILWPIALLACKADNARAIVSLFLGVLFLTVIQPTLVAFYGFKYYAIYNGVSELFLGAFLAFLYERDSIEETSSKTAKLAATILALIIWFYPNAMKQEFYVTVVVSSASVLLVAMAVFVKGSFRIPLLHYAFSFLGRRSFSFYAVQLLTANIIVFYTNSIYFPNESFSEYEFYCYQFIMFLVALFALTELTYRFIEKPFRRYGQGNQRQGRS
ncbi:MAG: acyltransferase [Holosporaceae bacterium]|jgi:peptidoglycan/LPS O-acetylase OafA/YrhL|nr:acyltransferase [Holosporaceae bacterium]